MVEEFIIGVEEMIVGEDLVEVEAGLEGEKFGGVEGGVEEGREVACVGLFIHG